MLRTKKGCKVCILFKNKNHKDLLNRVYNSSHYMKGGEPLIKIAEDYPHKFSYQSLQNHVKKHQFLNEDDFNERHMKAIVKKAEANIVKQAIQSSKVWDTIIDQGMESLEQGELTVTANHLLKAAKDKQDFEFKKKDQQLAMAEMIYHFASGESNQELSKPYDKETLRKTNYGHDRTIIEGEALSDNHPTSGTPDSPETGSGQPGGVYYPPTWNAAT